MTKKELMDQLYIEETDLTLKPRRVVEALFCGALIATQDTKVIAEVTGKYNELLGILEGQE